MPRCRPALLVVIGRAVVRAPAGSGNDRRKSAVDQKRQVSSAGYRRTWVSARPEEAASRGSSPALPVPVSVHPAGRPHFTQKPGCYRSLPAAPSLPASLVRLSASRPHSPGPSATPRVPHWLRHVHHHATPSVSCACFFLILFLRDRTPPQPSTRSAIASWCLVSARRPPRARSLQSGDNYRRYSIRPRGLQRCVLTVARHATATRYLLLLRPCA